MARGTFQTFIRDLEGIMEDELLKSIQGIEVTLVFIFVVLLCMLVFKKMG